MRILVVDDMPIVRDPIAAALRAAGHETWCAASGRDALLTIKSEQLDLILLDIHLPDMDGLQVARALRRNPATAQLPIILLSAEERKESILLAAKLGVQGYLLKSRFSLQELLARIDQVTSSGNGTIPGRTRAGVEQNIHGPKGHAGEIPQLLNRDQFLQRTKSVMQAKTLSGVVGQVMSLASAPRTELADLAAVVSRDTVIATRVLQAANSAAYRSAKGTVTTISDAIRQVGCSTIRNIAAAIGIFEAMPETSSDGFNPIRCWQHSFAVAQICENLATAGGLNSGIAYLVGLCHDLGEIVLHTQFGREYRQLMEFEKTTGMARHDLELRMLGMTHGELVSAILRGFGLPDAVRAPIEWFHANTTEMSLGSPHSMEGILRISEWYANGVMLASSESAQLNLLTSAQCKSAVGVQHPSPPDTEKLRTEIMALTGMLARLAPREEADLMNPLLGQTGKRIWVVRDASLSPIDPVSAAVKCLANARIMERSPSAAEMDEVDGLVVLGDPASQDATVASSSPIATSVPILRILAPGTASGDPALLCCPVTLSQLHDFCSKLPLRVKKVA